MSFKTRAFNIVLPEDLVRDIDAAANQEYRNRSDLIRESLRRYLYNNSEGRVIHGQAAQLRERGESVEALTLYAKALAAYQQAGDALGFAEVLSDEFLVLRHLFEKTEDKKWLILAKHTAMASVEVAKESGNKEALAIPLFNLAKALEVLGELEEASKTYQQALANLEKNPPKEHQVEMRSSMVADFKVHLATSEYMAGDKSALKRAEQALKELEEGTELAQSNKDVWLSGGHMRMAEILRQDNPKKAKEHLMEAKKIIDSNPELTLRKNQWEKLSQTF